MGLRAGDLTNPQLVREKVHHALLEKNVLLRELYKYDTLDENQVCEELLAIAPRITPPPRSRRPRPPVRTSCSKAPRASTWTSTTAPIPS